MILSYRVSQAIYVAATLGIADLLQEGPKRVEELAAAAGAHPGALSRLLRLLASVGVFAEMEEGRFALTPLASLLRTDVAGSFRATAKENGDLMYRAWGELLYSITTGQSAFEHCYGMRYFDYLTQHPELAASFDAARTRAATEETSTLAAAYDFSGLHTVVDVGGGQGALLTAILKANPQLRGVLVDLPHVVTGARRLLEAEGVLERCDLVAGDFLTAVPAGGDAYILMRVLHDWDDEHAVTILSNCRRVMGGRSKLLVVGVLMPPGKEPFNDQFIGLNDLNMLVLLAGRQRTEAEYRALFTAAGFTLTRVIPTPSARQSSVIEGVCASPTDR